MHSNLGSTSKIHTLTPSKPCPAMGCWRGFVLEQADGKCTEPNLQDSPGWQAVGTWNASGLEPRVTMRQKHGNSSGVSTCLDRPCNFRHEGETWIFTRRWTGAGWSVLQVTGCSPGRVWRQRLSVLLTLAEQRFGNPELRLYKSVSVFPCRLIRVWYQSSKEQGAFLTSFTPLLKL